MKSLRESLFDKDLVTRKLPIFGDEFELDDHDKSIVHNPELSKTYSYIKLKKALGVTGKDKDEIVWNGLRKLVETVVLVNDPDIANVANQLLSSLAKTGANKNFWSTCVNVQFYTKSTTYDDRVDELNNNVDFVTIKFGQNIYMKYHRK